ncbi:MAG: hypothetical protein AAGG51_29260 [Cyanobacteria bacterium P01_G01_bin.54]
MDDNKLDILKERCPTFFEMATNFEERVSFVYWIIGGIYSSAGIAVLIFGVIQKQLYAIGIGIAILILIPLFIIDKRMKEVGLKNYLVKIQRSPGSVVDYRFLTYNVKKNGVTIKSHSVIVTFNDRKKAEFGAKDEAQAKQSVQELAEYVNSVK